MICISFDEIWQLVLQLYDGDLNAANDWLDTPQPLLNGETPQALIAADRQAEVIAMLRRALDGVYI